MKFSTLFAVVLAVSAPAFSQVNISLSSLRTSTSLSTTSSYFVNDAGREGVFYYDSRDVTSLDNGGTIIVNGTKRFKRLYNGPLDAKWFGMKGDWNGTAGTENSASLKAAIAAAKKDEVLLIP